MYDGSGQRVEKIAGGTKTVYVWGRAAADGYGSGIYPNTPDVVSEKFTGKERDEESGLDYFGARYFGSAIGRFTSPVWSAQAEPVPYAKLDNPQSPTSATGGVVKRYDYVPFGEEVSVGIGGRAAGYGSGTYPNTPDVVSEKFTGKERDSESGLDYFGARYYGSALGRFTSADPKMIPDEFDNPQAWNKYSYTGNNPLRYTDPDGKDWKDVVAGAFNAFGSDNTFGAGRQTGNSDFRTGQAIGDGVAFVRGGVQMLAGAAGDVVGTLLDLTGVGAVVGVPAQIASTAVGLDGVGVAGTAAKNLISQASAIGPKQGANEPGSGKDFNNPTKADAVQENQTANGGQAKCVFCGSLSAKGRVTKSILITRRLRRTAEGMV